MAIRHHHVPQVLLKNFASNEKIWLFDKHENKVFRTHIRNAFVEGNYNTVTGDAHYIETEDFFTRLEDSAAPIIRSILRENSILHLGDIKERYDLATFVVAQHLRSQQTRKNFRLIREHLQERFPGAPQSALYIPGLSPTEVDKFASLDFLMKALPDLTQVIIQKDLLLVELVGPGGFWISDHPVILHNDKPANFMSNRGFGVAGIQIYLPISPTFAIAFFCPTIVRELEDGVAKITAARSSLFARSLANGDTGSIQLTMSDMMLQQKRVESYLAALRDKKKITFNKQNLLFLNSHQVLSAHRFIGAHDNKFSLVEDMLKQNPDLREPKHIGFG